METISENKSIINYLNNEPLIYEINNFLSDKECRHIIQVSEGNLKKSVVGNFNYQRESKVRTSSTYFLSILNDITTFEIFKKIISFLEKPGRNFDNFLQVCKYNETQKYEPHCDPSVAKNNKLGILHRKFTVICYLTDVEEGGETEFVNLGIKVVPKKGKLLYFDNYNNQNKVDINSKHYAKPVLKGEKWIFNLWYSDKDYYN